MNKSRLVFAAAVLFFSSTLAFGQDEYFSHWFDRVDHTQSEQPHWITPVATTTPRLEEEVRYDQDWLQHADGYRWDEYDGAKGVELIPWYKTELIIQAPPYYEYNGDPSETNGVGDIQFLVKYRILSRNEEHGNYILTAFLGWSIPTGSYSNGVGDRGQFGDNYANDCVWQGVRQFRCPGNLRGAESHHQRICQWDEPRLE